MNDIEKDQQMNQPPNDINKPVKRRRGYVTAAIIAALGLTTILGAQAYSGSRMAQHIEIESAYSSTDGKVWNVGFRRNKTHFSDMSADDREKQIKRMVGHLAVEIEASDEQKAQLVTLARSVIDELLPMRDKMKGSREEVIKLLSAPTIDRAALEALRKAKLGEADIASQSLVKAVADAAEILTAEQRATLVARIETFRSMRGRWRH